MAEENFDQRENVNVTKEVMEGIQSKKVKMRSRLVFVMEKLGLEGAVVLSAVLGVIFGSLVFHFFEKTKLLGFLKLGMPGLGIFFSNFPYQYIIFFAIAAFAVIFFANSTQRFCGKCSHGRFFATGVFFGVFLLGIFFGFLGLGKILGGWVYLEIPHDRTVHGAIQSFNDEEVVVIDDGGEVVEIFSKNPPMPDRYMTGKFLRAIGHRDSENPHIFYAERVRCCEDD